MLCKQRRYSYYIPSAAIMNFSTYPDDVRKKLEDLTTTKNHIRKDSVVDPAQ